MSSGSESAVKPEVGDVVRRERAEMTENALATSRLFLRQALTAYGDTLDDTTREILSAVDAIDRARKRLRESMRGGGN